MKDRDRERGSKGKEDVGVDGVRDRGAVIERRRGGR